MPSHKNVLGAEAANESTSKFTLEDIRDMKPIGRSIPAINEDTSQGMYYCTFKVVDKAPETSKHEHRGLSWLQKLSPANRAYDKADVTGIEGDYYSVDPEGRIIQTTVVRCHAATAGGLGHASQAGGCGM